MKIDRIEEAIQAMEVFGSLGTYEHLIDTIKENDMEAIEEFAYGAPHGRMEILHTLIKADYFCYEELISIYKVDRFILNNEVPPMLNHLKAWLKRHALTYRDPEDKALGTRSTLSPAPVYYGNRHGSYSKKEIEFFQRRNEAYLNLWENATIEDIKKADFSSPRSLINIRSALQRVFWGDHFSRAELIRLVHVDLRFLEDDQADQMALQFKRLIEELLEQHDLKELFIDQEEYEVKHRAASETRIKEYLNSWDWFSHDWSDYFVFETQCRESFSARINLDEYYKNGILGDQAILELIELDKAALLSPNWAQIRAPMRLIVSKFLVEQGVFDPLDDDFILQRDDRNSYIKE